MVKNFEQDAKKALTHTNTIFFKFLRYFGWRPIGSHNNFHGTENIPRMNHECCPIFRYKKFILISKHNQKASKSVKGQDFP